MSAITELRLVSLEVFSEPFPYFTAEKGLGGAASLAVLEWLESDAPWRLVETDFYEQYEFSFLDVALPANLAFLGSRSFLADLTSNVEWIFGASLSTRIDVTAHKLMPGQRIRIHNDYIPRQESHRVLIQLTRGWNETKGGYLMFFNSDNPADVHRVFPPFHNSMVGFTISPESNHAVSTIHEGERFTLVYSFYRRADSSE